MRRALLLALLSLAAAPAAHGATLTVSDGECQWRATFDPVKIDRVKLQATLDYLAGPEPLADPGSPLTEPDEIATVDVAAYKAGCAERHDHVAAVRFLYLPEVEALRRTELAALDGTCAINAARLAAAKGDLAPMRAGLGACTRWVEALATPAATLRRVYDERLADLCHDSTELNLCMDHLQKEGEKAPRDVRMRLALLREGWTRCASAHVGDGGGARRRTLRDTLFHRFKAKALSCAQ